MGLDCIICISEYRFCIYRIYVNAGRASLRTGSFLVMVGSGFQSQYGTSGREYIKYHIVSPNCGILVIVSKRIGWKHAAGVGLGISVVIELSQLIFLPRMV